MNNESAIFKSTCHCGAVELRLRLPNGLQGMRRCNCSICSRRGVIAATIPIEDLTVVRGADRLTLYQFGTHTAKHYFCKTCGIYTHHLRRSNPNQYAVNVACLDGINPYELGEVEVLDGINHPADRV